jgi:hypothetical protein
VTTYTTSPHLTADEILYIAAGRRTIDLDRTSLLVVTGTHTPAAGEPQQWPFTPGEILIITGGTELLGTRSIEPWDTRTLSYWTSDVRSALSLSDLIRSGAGRGMWEWDGDRWYRSIDQVASMEALNSAGSDPTAVFIGDTDGSNTWGMDVAYPGRYVWPDPRSGT